MSKYIVFWTLEQNYSIINQTCLRSTNPGDVTEGKFMGKIYPCIVVQKESRKEEVKFKKFLQRALLEDGPEGINSRVTEYVKNANLQWDSNPREGLSTCQQQLYTHKERSIVSKTSSHAKENSNPREGLSVCQQQLYSQKDRSGVSKTSSHAKEQNSNPRQGLSTYQQQLYSHKERSSVSKTSSQTKEWHNPTDGWSTNQQQVYSHKEGSNVSKTSSQAKENSNPREGLSSYQQQLYSRKEGSSISKTSSHAKEQNSKSRDGSSTNQQQVHSGKEGSNVSKTSSQAKETLLKSIWTRSPLEDVPKLPSGETNHKKRSVDLVEIDSDTDEEGKTCLSCKRLKERIAFLERQQESLKQRSEQQSVSRPTPGVVDANVAKEFNMVEVYAGTGIYWFRSQRDFIIFNSNGPEQLISKAVDVFFSKDALKKSSALGGGQYEALDETIVNACICFVQKRWDVKTASLRKIINDKCSNARRPRRLGLYSHETYMYKKAKKIKC